MKWKLIFVLGMIILAVGSTFLTGDVIEDRKESWKAYYLDVRPGESVSKWQVPFRTGNRNNPASIRVISTFGAHRNSYVCGHIHAGIDLIPRTRSAKFTYVYPMAAGRICSIHLGHPHKTVVVVHKKKSGEILYTSYKHLKEIYPQNGEVVTSETRLGRLYTRREALALGGNYDHLHLEIRKKFDDYGVASWATMNKAALKLRFYDPLLFIKNNVGL